MTKCFAGLRGVKEEGVVGGNAGSQVRGVSVRVVVLAEAEVCRIPFPPALSPALLPASVPLKSALQTSRQFLECRWLSGGVA